MKWQFSNDAPIYSQLIAQIKVGIVSGAFPPGERLPSVRDLATEAGVNPNTMQRALTELERDGLVYSQRTTGRFVTEDQAMIASAKRSLAERHIQAFLEAMTHLGYGREEILTLLRQEETKTMAVLECKDLSKHYGNAPALNHVSLAVEPGRIVGLLGPNGSGKTTLIKLANGLLTPSEGEVLVCDMAPGKESHASVSYLPERTCIPTWMSVKQLLDFYGDFYRDFNRKAAEEMLTHLNIRLTQRIKQMSKGTREKVQLIMVMSRAAKLYLLDEPIGGVDPATRDYILSTIIGNYNPEAAVIISTHLIADVEKVLDEVIFINQGQVVLQSSVDEIREEKGMSVDALFREVFKC